MIILSPLFSDNMVIQYGVPVPVWGKAAAGAEVSVALESASASACADVTGDWRLTLPPVPAGGPYTMEITAGREIVTLNGVYAGDVWLAAGQSNMELPMQRLRDDYSEEWDSLASQNLPSIHHFKVPQECDFSGPRQDLSGGCWIPASEKTLDEFPGAAWFFAKKIYEKHNIPIGIINTAWGGTPIEAWMSREALAPFPGKINLASAYADSTLCREITRISEAHIKEWDSFLIKKDKGLAEKWYAAETDISQWNNITLPGNFSDAGLAGFCGVIWLCRDFTLDDDWANFSNQQSESPAPRLWLGTIVDADTVYINGKNVGSTAYRYPPRKYSIPVGLLHKGVNRIAIRVTCSSADGGITRGKPFRIFSDAGCFELAGPEPAVSVTGNRLPAGRSLAIPYPASRYPAEAWKYRIGISAHTRPSEFFFHRQPTGPYNAMIAPLLKFPVKGVIWYQGESNDNNPGEYRRLFQAMIRDIRTKSGMPGLPFIFVQLPVFHSPKYNNEADSWAQIREAQQTALTLPYTGMAVALDLGEWNDLHPVNKKDVGYRLALSAEKLVYSADTTSPGPLVRTYDRRDSRLFIWFDNCGAGLRRGAEADGGEGGQSFVSVICKNGQLRLPAEIEGTDCLSVDISRAADPQTVLYAWADNPRDRNLYNSEGLPVLPFRIFLR